MEIRSGGGWVGGGSSSAGLHQSVAAPCLASKDGNHPSATPGTPHRDPWLIREAGFWKSGNGVFLLRV